MATKDADHPAPDDTLKHADQDGQFRRVPSKFRNFIRADKNAEFPAEADRYVLYLNYGCPWAHRTNIVRSLKGLDNVVQLVVMDFLLTQDGWLFTGENGTAPKDPLYGFTKIKDLYHKADPNYNGRFTVPMLWDKKKETIVSNESAEIIRMFYSEFDHLLPESNREVGSSNGPFYPEQLRSQIDAMNEWVYDTVNNGVYKCGFATSQEAYDSHVYTLFKSLDRLEEHLRNPKHQPYLFGDHITEADIRLYPTMVRFDPAYVPIFKCNLKMIRHDYPLLHDWMRRLYYDESIATNGGAFHNTTYFDCFKKGYARAAGVNVIPAGPSPSILPLQA